MGFNHSAKREQLRRQYERFVVAWQNERRYQQFLITEGQPLEEGHQRLGRKPTFRMWMEAVRNKRIAARVGEMPPVAPEQDPKRVEVTDTEWDETA